ncbi:LysR family transcriptional regulator [Rouxiella sp. WC2420]|uniref:LysR family transcriptional regulator n=1 Tax=Rouxiella sp. WC2420 TaxID=3234145 RepID=A0AB39VWV4_9GAMM
MRYSPEALLAFVATADSGSFSAAARKLNKSQSTVSTAVANLEIDLGITLFNREGRQPRLTPEGQRVLTHVQAILSASEQLDHLAVRLTKQAEPRLTFVLSDTYQPTHYEMLLGRFEQRYPDIEFECLIAEDQDVIDLLHSGRAHVGMLEVQENYPPDIGYSRLPDQTEMALFVFKNHPLAAIKTLRREDLSTYRQLCLQTYGRQEKPKALGQTWSAPSYLMLLEMAEQGFGWSILPRWLVAQFGHHKLIELELRGWPKLISIDAVWCKTNQPGPAGRWFIDSLLDPLRLAGQ